MALRDHIENPIQFCEQVEKRIKSMVQLDLERLRSSVIDNPNLNYRFNTIFIIKNPSLDDLLRLGILVWYLPKEISFVLRMDLLEKEKFLSLEDRTLLNCILQSKAQMLIFLQETTLWHTRDFFGNLLNSNYKLDRFLKIGFRLVKVKKPERKRGYNDKGSKAPEEKWLPRFDFTLTELQNKIEQTRQSYEDTKLFIQGLLM